MTAVSLRQLAILSVTNPAQAAQNLLALPVPREALWVGLGLVAVLNALLFSLSNAVVPGPSPLPGLFDVPVIYCAIVAGGLVLTIYALYWTGRMFGGSGTVDDVMLVIVWLQFLRIFVQGAALVLVLTVPALSALLVFGASLYGLYMLLHFFNQAHRFNSVGRAAGVLIASMLAIVLGLSVLITLLGGPIDGSSFYV